MPSHTSRSDGSFQRNHWFASSRPHFPFLHAFINHITHQNQHDFERTVAGEEVVQRSLNDFIHATLSGTRLVLPVLPETLTPGDAAKLRNRLTMLSRQTGADPVLAQANLDTLLRSFHAADAVGNAFQPPPERLDEWNVGKHADAFESAWSSATSTAAIPAAAAAAAQPSSWAAEFIGASAARVLAPGTPQALEQAWTASSTAATTTTATEDAGLESAWEDNARGAAAPAAANTEETAEKLRLAAAGVATSAAAQDSAVGATQFMQFMRDLGSGALRVQGNAVVPGAEQQQHSTATSSAWSAEFAAALDADAAFHEDGSAAQDSWADEFVDEGDAAAAATGPSTAAAVAAAAAEEVLADAAVPAETAAIGVGYTFTAPAANTYVAHAQPFAKAQALFAAGATSEAVLACEAELLRAPRNAAAWRLLGLAQAQADSDSQACAALGAAHRLEPQNRETLMALGVALTNDLHREEAVDALREWLARHPVYSTLRAPPAPELEEQVLRAHSPAGPQDAEFRGMLDTLLRNAETVALFSAAARTEQGRADADVHVALGLLHTLAYSFAEAAEDFRAAVALRPRDAALWNKLGATLANDGRSEDAVAAYRRALELQPGYVRAHSNMGIAFLTANQPAEGARCFLRALALDPAAEHLWDSLRLAFHQLSRPDLVDRITLHDPEYFREEFDF